MSISPGLAAFKISFQLSPVVFCNGIRLAGMPRRRATNYRHHAGGLALWKGLLSVPRSRPRDDFFCQFPSALRDRTRFKSVRPVPICQSGGPAANARISAAVHYLSCGMICPARDEAGYALKLATMTALQAALAQHDSLGGTYTIATPSIFLHELRPARDDRHFRRR